MDRVDASMQHKLSGDLSTGAECQYWDIRPVCRDESRLSAITSLDDSDKIG